VPSFPLLDVAIGLSFVYLLLSLICSSINEGIESFLRNRANDLEAGIRKLLGDSQGSWWRSCLPWINSIAKPSITREFYRHPLIAGLVRTEKQLPTYIPSRSFALAVMDMAVKDGSLLLGATRNAPPAQFEFADAVNGIPIPDSLKQSIRALVTAAAGDAQQARANIEDWFNSSMDRVSGWYKSRTQKILFTIGVAVTIAVNADSVDIFRNLNKSKDLQSVVSAAQNLSSRAPAPGQLPQVAIGDAMNQLIGLDIGLGWVPEKQQTGPLNRAKIPPSLHPGACQIETWPCNPVSWTAHLIFLHGIGWLITAAALALGAPFWFDTLSRVIVVRSTVKPKEAATSGTNATPVAGPLS
jgi:hypothetical protein